MRKKKNLSGFVYLNKPAGITSRACLGKLLERFSGKAGLEGILDPFAEGLLIVGYGRATRFLPYIHYFKKHYLGEIVFGIGTDSDDHTGQIISYGKTEHITEEKILQVLGKFQGEIVQIPPAFSNVKVHGMRSHKLARLQAKPLLPERKVFVYKIELSPIEKPWLWKIEAIVSKGTYIRSLARDIALALGTVGHLRKLVRIAIGQILLQEALPVEKVTEKNFLPEDAPFLEWKRVDLESAWYFSLRNGQKIVGDFPAGFLRLYYQGEFMGIGKSNGKFLWPERIPKT